MIKRLLGLGAAIAVLFAGFFVVVRPWYRQWGATAGEVRGALPGDALVAEPAWQETRAITINAPAGRVWPWLAQIGQDRGGFYSYDILENIAGCDMPTVDVLRPGKQSWQLGDRLWMYPKDKAGGVGFATLREFIPGQALAFATHVPGSGPAIEDGSWTFVLAPNDSATTRFLIRGRGPAQEPLLRTVFNRAVFEPIHFAMERRTLIGLKQVAEGGNRSRAENNVLVALWVVSFAFIVAAAVLVLVRPRWVRALAAFLSASVVFEVLTLGQPSAIVAWALLILVALVLGVGSGKGEEGRRKEGTDAVRFRDTYSQRRTEILAI